MLVLRSVRMYGRTRPLRFETPPLRFQSKVHPLPVDQHSRPALSFPAMQRAQATATTPQQATATTTPQQAGASTSSYACGTALWDRIVTVYSRAQQKQAALTTGTTTQPFIDEKYGVTFIVKVAETLRDKPKALSKEGASSKHVRNPFLPYEEDLWVAHVSETHTLLLNKFNVVPYHVLVVTREFEPQTSPLTVRDFAVTWVALQAMPEGGLAYFNGGPLSGASQPHKHVQLVPLPLERGLTREPPFATLVHRALENRQPGSVVELRGLPFQAYCCDLRQDNEPAGCAADGIANAPQSPGNDTDVTRAATRVHAAYDLLMQRVRASTVAAQDGVLDPGSVASTAGSDELAVHRSYNLVMTREWMMVCPRSVECSGPVSVNSMGFAGSFFVRSTAELDHLQTRGPMAVLAEVGVPWDGA